MKRRVIVLPVAVRDLDRQAAYLAARASARTAGRFLRAAEKTFRLIRKHPQMGSVTRYQSTQLPGTRMFPIHDFPKHLIFYRLVEGEVEVIRVIHGAQDIEALFNEE